MFATVTSDTQRTGPPATGTGRSRTTFAFWVLRPACHTLVTLRHILGLRFRSPENTLRVGVWTNAFALYSWFSRTTAKGKIHTSPRRHEATSKTQALGILYGA